jgi:hypothetical protein
MPQGASSRPFHSSQEFRGESDKKCLCGAELDMTTCRIPQSGGVPGATARSADQHRIDSPASRGTRTQLPPMPARPRWRAPAARRPQAQAQLQPPDFATLVRVRDGLKRL